MRPCLHGPQIVAIGSDNSIFTCFILRPGSLPLADRPSANCLKCNIILLSNWMIEKREKDNDRTWCSLASFEALGIGDP